VSGPELHPEYVAEMEDRAAEQVDRDWLLLQAHPGADPDAREAIMLADRAEFGRREAERDELDDRYRGRRELGEWRY
jgi:flagellar biosynthesis regulator FlaF